MPLDFRSRDEDGLGRFLKTVGLGVAVFLVFMAIGYYGLGPRITVSESGHIQLRLTSVPEGATQPQTPPPSKRMPKVVVHEKLPPEVTAGTGLVVGAREVAPFDYNRYQQKRRERKHSPRPADKTPAEEPLPMTDEYFVPDESAKIPPLEPLEEELVPTPTEPSASQTPDTPSTPNTEPHNEGALYRVQVGVYENRENAHQTVKSLIASGFEASIVPFQRDGKTLYRVQTLVTHDRTKAYMLKSQLESKGFPAVVSQAQ
jgi:cell division protein FtsN